MSENPMAEVSLLDLFEKDPASWTDEEIDKIVVALRTQSAEYEKELDLRKAKKKAREEKAKSTTLDDILKGNLDDDSEY